MAPRGRAGAGAAKLRAAPAAAPAAAGKPSRPPTAFERRVYALCAAIPRGRVATYGGMAAALACGSARAVGQALRRNPFAPLPVPCHRVVAADRDIGGFSGEWGPCCPGGQVSRKRALLREEGVMFESEDEEKEGREAGGAYWRVARASVLSPAQTAALRPAAAAVPGGGGKAPSPKARGARGSMSE